MNTSLLLLINGWAGSHPLLDTAMIFSANYLIYIIFAVTAGCMAYLLYKRRWRPVILFGATLVVSYLLLMIASHIYVDHRPFVDHHLTQLIAHAPGKSFPSDHTTVATAIALGLLAFTRFKKTGVVFLVLAVLIGFARIFVGVHYPIDIAGGIIVPAIGTLIVYLISTRFVTHAQPVSFDNPTV
jgi:undecaprenyl-diphosphatase